MQFDFAIQRFYRYSSRWLPQPLVPCCPQYCFYLFSIHIQAELTCSFAFFPRRSPVIGTYIHIICAFFRKFDLRRRIFHRLTHTVRQKIRRTHYVHELLVYHPAALATETFGLDKKEGRFYVWKYCKQCEQKNSEEFGFHGYSFYIKVDKQIYENRATYSTLRPQII